MITRRIVILGPQGAGKGTQASRLARAFRLAHVSVGDILRAEVAKQSLLGRRLRRIASGHLIPDPLVNELIRRRLRQPDCRRGWILDGYPRTLPQARWLDRALRPTLLISLRLRDRQAVTRLGGRRVCPAGHIYHIRYRRPKRRGRCDHDGLPLRQREDDAPAAIRRRLRLYHRQTEPIVRHYRRRWPTIEVDASPPIPAVYRSIRRQLKPPVWPSSPARQS